MATNALNTAVCSIEDVQQALAQQNVINQQFLSVINTVSASDHKVAVNATDQGNAGADYLHVKLYGDGTFNDGTDCLVRSETVTDSQERLFWSPGDITNYSNTGDFVLSLSDNALAWLAQPNIVDSYEVKCTSGDTTPKYLHAAFNLNATYVSGADVLVGTATVGASSTNQTERLFVDVSAVSGYNSTGTYILGMVDNVTQYILASDLEAGGDNFTVKCTSSDTTASFLHAALTTAATRDTSADPIVAAQTASPSGNETETLFVDSSTISGWDATKLQDYINDNGTVKFTNVFKVSATTGDSTPDVLHSSLHYNSTPSGISDNTSNDSYNSSQDAKIYNETVGAGGTDQNERLYFNSSTITGFDASKTQLLGHVSGTLQWDTIANWLKRLESYDATKNQSIGHDIGTDPVWQEDGTC